MSCPDWRRLDPAARDASGAPGAAGNAGKASNAGGAVDADDALLHAVHWQQALSHLDSGCPHCWREALAVDPTLIFRRLPVPELSPAQEAEEVEAARLAVAAMRTASRLEARGRRDARSDAGGRASAASGLLRRWQDRQDRQGWRKSQPALAVRRLPALRLPASLHDHAARWALAAGLTAMALVYGSGHGWHPPAAGAAPGAPAGAALASGRSPAGSESPDTFGSSSIQAGQAIRASSAFAASESGPRGARMVPVWAAAPGAQPAASRPSIEGLSRPEARVYQIDSPHMSVVMIVDDKLDV
jgi:hypothetical protein